MLDWYLNDCFTRSLCHTLSLADSDNTTRFFVGVQVDVTAVQPGQTTPTWTKDDAADAKTAKQGTAAAASIGAAIQGVAYTAGNPWAGIGGTVMKRKPHKSDDKAYQVHCEVSVCL